MAPPIFSIYDLNLLVPMNYSVYFSVRKNLEYSFSETGKEELRKSRGVSVEVKSEKHK